MSIRKVFVIGLLVFSAAACKKADHYMNDPEDGLALDTAVFLKSVNFVSATPTQLVLEVEMMKFNGIESETVYSSEVFHDSVVSVFSGTTDGYTITSSAPVEVTYAPANYSNIFVFSRLNPWWYPYFNVSPFVQRYLQQIEDLPSANYAFSMTGLNDGSLDDIVLYEETVGQPFNNSYQFTIENLMTETKSLGEYSKGDSLNISNFANEISLLINQFDAHPGYTGERSITFFLDRDLMFQQAPLETIIADANGASIQLNFVGVNLGYSCAALAHGTGGFVIDGFNHMNYEEFSSWEEPNPVKNVGVGISNLHTILSHDQAIERRTVTINSSSGVFTSGAFAGISLWYNDHYYETGIFIP